MKQLIYILFLLVSFGQALFARGTDTLRVERLELCLEPDLVSIVPCGKEWFQTQKDAWKQEIDKDARNEKAWENYYLACKGVCNEDTLLWKKEQPRLLKKMKKYVPDTRVYYKVLDDEIMIPDKEKRAGIKKKIASLKRDCEKDYRDDMWYYQRHGQTDKVREIAREWFDSGLYSRSILTYYYNEFVGLEKNAVLAGTGPQWAYSVLLQYGAGLFKDVEVVNLSELMNPEVESDFWKAKGIDVNTFPDREKVKCPGAWYFTEKEKRPVYISQYSASRQDVERMKDFLYSEGLVFRYSLKPYDNMAILRRNYEQVYLLDYLQSPIITDISRGEDSYILSFLPLLQFYHTSGDKNQYLRLKKLLLGIVERIDAGYFVDKSWVDAKTAEHLKLVSTIFNHVKDMEREGSTSLRARTFEEEYRKEYQQLIEMVEP